MKKILFISPDFDSEFSGCMKTMNFSNKTTLTMPLHFATIAALTPDDIEIHLWDEPIHGKIEETTEVGEYDLAAITAYLVHMPRAREIAAIFHRHGIPVAIGGQGASAAPEQCYKNFDILFIGEAELTWPRFIDDWKKGRYQKEYRQVEKLDLSISPVPRWDNVMENIKSYYTGTIQTTRGCPFDCEFCDVIYLLGRRPRHKPIDSVLEEVRNLERLGVKRIFFCNNFSADPPYTKKLLKELIPLNNSFAKPILYTTQLHINAAKDEELLTLLSDANFGFVLIGLEALNKRLDCRAHLIEDVKKIQSYGLFISATMNVGFDCDDSSIFDRQYEFLRASRICNPQIHILHAYKGTKLWTRLQKEGRLIGFQNQPMGASVADTNIIPKLMTRRELMEGWVELLSKSRSWETFTEGVKGFISGIKRRPNISQVRRDFGPMAGRFQEFLHSLDEDARIHILDLAGYTFQQAPFMLERVFELIMKQLRAVDILPSIRQIVQKKIGFETIK